MKLCYFDDVTTGHHASFLHGLAVASVSTGADAIVASPINPDVQNVEWMPIPGGGRSHILRGRKALRKVSRISREADVDLFADLNLDRSIWILPNSLGRLKRRVHVLHHGQQYLYEERSSTGRGRTRYLRGALKRLTARGDYLVTHTSRAADILGEIVPGESILQLGYPIRYQSLIAGPPTDPQPSNPVILFVGQARREKGLSDLLSAVDPISGEVTVRVVGPQKTKVRQELAQRFSHLSVIWEDRFVGESELAGFYQSASLIATPYRSRFGRDGGASGVLLEALAFGKPVLTTEALSQQLPCDYEGAVVVQPDNPTALSKGIREALESLPVLTASARSRGPAFISQNHSFENYVRRLIEWTQ